MVQYKSFAFTLAGVLIIILNCMITNTQGKSIFYGPKTGDLALPETHLSKRGVGDAGYATLTVLLDTLQAIWNSSLGGDSKLATPSDSPGIGKYREKQIPGNLFDNNLKTLYSSFGNSAGGINDVAGLHTGIRFDVAQCEAVLTGFRLGSGQTPDLAGDPINTVIFEGSNGGDPDVGSSWTLIYCGPSGLEGYREPNQYGDIVWFDNSVVYKSYRFTVIEKRGKSRVVSYSELILFGKSEQKSCGEIADYPTKYNVPLSVQLGSVHPVWWTKLGTDSWPAVEGDGASGTYKTGTSAEYLFDGNLKSVYSSYGDAYATNRGVDTGFYFNVAECGAVLTGFRYCVGHANPNADPITITIEGSCAEGDHLTKGSSWVCLYEGTTGLSVCPNRLTCGDLITIPNDRIYKSYRFLVTTKRKDKFAFSSYSEVKLYGNY